MLRIFDTVRAKILSQLAEGCPYVHADKVFVVEYQDANLDERFGYPARLHIGVNDKIDASLWPYFLNMAAAHIEHLKDIGTKNGFYIPQNDGRFYLSATPEALANIVNKETENQKFVEAALRGSVEERQRHA